MARAIDQLLARVRDSLLRERTLTADAAHELRTPLAAMRLQAQVARRSKGGAELDAALDELLAGADRAARMVDSVLTLARFDAGCAESIGRRSIDLGRLAQLVGAEFVPLAELRSVSIGVTSDGSQTLGADRNYAIGERPL